MSNGKENIKKSLGITEYPWSSDDDDNESSTIPNVHLLHNSYQRQVEDSRASVANLPGTSGSSQPPPPPPRPPPHPSSSACTDRDAYWNLINNPHRPMPSSSGINRGRQEVTQLPFSRTMSHLPAEELRSSSDRGSTVAEIKRIIAIKKLTRSLTGLRSNRPGSNLNTPRGNAGTTRHSSFFNSHLELSAPPCSFNHNRPKRHGHSNFTPMRHNSNSREPQPCSSATARRHAAAQEALDNARPLAILPMDQSDDNDDNELNRLGDDNDANDGNEEGIQNASVEQVSLEEDIVEIEGNITNDNDELTAMDVPEGNDNNNNPASVNESNAEEPQRQQGVKRKREGNEDSSEHSSEPCTVKELNSGLLRLLECPVCLEWMEPPMCQCRRGHLVCGRCRARLASCPVCRTAFSSLRNRAMEGVAEMLRYPCRHGCGREVRLRRRGPHEASCAARRYPCPAPVCAARPPLPLHDLHKHAQTKHPAMVKVGRKHRISVKLSSEQHDNWVVSALHELFHLRLDVLRPFGVVVYVSYIGPKRNAHNFIYEVTVTGQHNSRKLIYARATHSDLESSSLNVSRQDCFYLTLDQALNFLRVKNRHSETDNSLDFNIEITKSEAAETEDREDSDS